MAGIKALRRLQLSIEQTAGTIKAASTVWRGTGTIKDDRNVVLVNEDVGVLGGVTRAYVPKLGASLTLAETPATFEQLPYILTCGFAALTTGVADSTGSGKVYTYALATTAAQTPSSLTVEGGDNQEAEVMEYCFVKSFKLTWAAGEAVQMSAELVGRQVALQAFTGAVAIPIVEEVLASKGKLFIDAIAGTAGTTEKALTMLAGELDVETGFDAVFTQEGNLTFGQIRQAAPKVTASVTFLHNATAAAEKVNWRAITAKQLGFTFTGATLTTAGNYAAKTLKVTGAGLWDTFSTLDEQDGNDIVKGTFQGRYDVTNAKGPLSIVVVNNLASLP